MIVVGRSDTGRATRAESPIVKMSSDRFGLSLRVFSVFKDYKVLQQRRAATVMIKTVMIKQATDFL